MDAHVILSADQKQFLARACAFIDTHPPQHEIDKLLTLATMLLPAPAAAMLEKRAAEAKSCPSDPDDRQLTRRLH